MYQQWRQAAHATELQVDCRYSSRNLVGIKHVGKDGGGWQHMQQGLSEQ
jgi:hypothetical protein